jgi:hypothetical protein
MYDDTYVCAAAAEGGWLDVLQWLRADECNWDASTCQSAAMGGHLHVLQWARANGCEWDEETCRYAAAGGHVETLQWAQANGCPWDEDVYEEYLMEMPCLHAISLTALQVPNASMLRVRAAIGVGGIDATVGDLGTAEQSRHIAYFGGPALAAETVIRPEEVEEEEEEGIRTEAQLRAEIRTARDEVERLREEVMPRGDASEARLSSALARLMNSDT